MIRNKMWKYYTLRLAYLLLGRLSRRTLYGIAHIFGEGAFYFRHTARSAVIANMRHVLGPEASNRTVRRAAHEVFRNATRYYADLLSVPRMNLQRFSTDVLTLEGLEYLSDAQKSGRGVVLVSGHFGSPELSVQALAAHGFHVYSLTEPLQPKALSDFTLWLRSQHGHEYRPLGYRAMKEAILRLKRGEIVALLFDRDVSNTGVPMEFFGATTNMPLGAVDIALRTNAQLVPAWSWRVDNFRLRARIGPPLPLVQTGDFDKDVRTNTQQLVKLFECHLRSAPGQWAVLEAIWD